MDHYKQYTTEDFIQDHRFRSWVRQPSPREDQMWQRWMEENPHLRGVLERARATVLAIHPVHTESISDAEIGHEVQQIMHILQQEDKQTAMAVPVRQRAVTTWLKIAAAVSLLLLAGWYVVDVLSPGQETQQALSEDDYIIERVNESETPILITLPDNSSVLLSQNSRILYPKAFAGNTRNVQLQGEAFFEVTKNAQKPFYVTAGQIVAKVLGTSFEINTHTADQQVRVIVRTGTVGIYANPDHDGKDFNHQPNVILTQNEQLTYKEVGGQLQHTRLDAQAIRALQVPDTYLKFSGTPVAEAFAALSRIYGVTIDYEPDQVKGCSVTARFTDEPFALKLDLICRSIGVNYTLANDRVTISGSGCRN